MKPQSRLIAQVSPASQAQNIRWIILEEDSKNTGGWYLYGHQNLDEGSDFDSWHPTRSEAQREAYVRWGLTEDDWKPAIANEL